ncbi:MAG: HD domain-containing protein [Candidatus Peribacteraceae bacterium]|nr:HD domain-containing protein [Candidatus Peribacteraceae bacterium]
MALYFRRLPLSAVTDPLTQDAAPNRFASLQHALVLAHRAHGGQRRLDGSSFIGHPLAVFQLLMSAAAMLPAAASIAALLHDAMEKSGIGRRQLESQFGQEVADVVEALTRKHHTDTPSLEEEHGYLLQLTRTNELYPYALLIKLADRIHNIETCHFLPTDRRDQLLKITRDLYVPLFEAQAYRPDFPLAGAYELLFKRLVRSLAIVEDLPPMRKPHLDRTL